MQPTLRLLITSLTVIFLLFTSTTVIAQTTLTADQEDYAPGSTATLTGTGFQAGESVTVQVVHADGTPDTGEDHEPWTVTADNDGNFVTTWHVCEDDCVGALLKATADGMASGAHAETTFTDAQLNKVVVGNQSGSAFGNGSATIIYGTQNFVQYDIAVTATNGGPFSITVSLSISGLPVGVTPTFLPDKLTFTSATTLHATLILNVQAGTKITSPAPTFTVTGTVTEQIQTSGGTPQPVSNGTSKNGGNTLTISPRPVAPSFGADNKIYDGSDNATITANSLALTAVAGDINSGKVAGDNVSLALSGNSAVTFDTKNVGTNKTVTATNLTLSGTDAINYTLSNRTATAQANITSKTITGSITVVNPKIYDGTTAATIATRPLTGVITIGNKTDDVSLTGGSATFIDKNVGNNKTVTPGNTPTPFSLTGTDAGNYTLNPAILGTTANITPLTITASVTVLDKVYDAGTNGTIDTRTLIGLPNTGTENVFATGGIATFKSASVGTDIVVNVTNLSLGGADAGNYNLNPNTASTTADITPKHITGNIMAADKVYDGTADATPAPLYTLTGAVDASVTLTGGPATFADKNVGVDKVVTAINLSLQGNTRTNYILDNTTATDLANISKRDLTITGATGVTKTYDGTDAATVTFTDDRTSFLKNNDVIVYNYTATFTAGKNVGNSKTISICCITLSGADAGNYNLKTPTPATASAAIQKRGIRVTAQHDDRVYDGTVNSSVVPVIEIAQLQVGDVIVTQPSQTYNNFNVGTGKTLTPAGMVINDGNNGGNYNIMYATDLTGIITQRPITITVNSSQSKIYGQSDPVFTYNPTAFSASPAQGLATTDAFNGALTRVAGENVNTYNILQTGLTIVRSGTSPLTDVSGNYAITYLGTTFAINQRPITINVTAGQSKVYGQLDPTFAYSYTPNPANSTAGLAFSDAFSGTLSRTSGENISSGSNIYNILQTGLTIKDGTGTTDVSGNYDITYNGTTFAITKRPISVTVSPNQSKVYGQLDPAFAYSYTATTHLPSTEAGLAFSDAFSGALTRVAGETVAASPYLVNLGGLIIQDGSGTTDVSANYTINFINTNKFAITPLGLTITPNSGQSKVYGQVDPTFTYGFSPALANGDVAANVFTGKLGRAVGETVAGGPYAYSLGNLSAGTNYSLSLSTATPLSTFAITPLGLTITPTTGQSKVYGQVDPTFTYAYSPALANGDVAANVFTGKLGRVSGETVAGGPYAYLLGNLSAGTNYSLNLSTATPLSTFSITQKALTVAANVPAVQYSDILQVSYQITGFEFNETLATSGVTGQAGFTTNATLSSNNAVLSGPGTYTITPVLGTLTAGNYSFSFTAGNFNVTQENARAYYTGALFASTSSTTSTTATVTLSATIKDITEVDYAGDPNAGDIRKATVTFVNRDAGNAVLGTAPLSVGLVDGSNTKVGTATVNCSLDAGTDSKQYTIGIIVSGWYTRNCSEDNTVVTVSLPTPGLITGGGYVLLKNSAGSRAGTTDTKNNFGFNVKLSKSGAPQGNINTIVRRLEADNIMHVYQMKGNSMTSLNIQGATDALPGTATFNGKANIQDITYTDPNSPEYKALYTKTTACPNCTGTYPVSVDGNASLQITMTDLGEPGTTDKIGITLWDKSGGLWFTNNWNGTKTIEQQLGGGNLKVSGTTSTAPAGTASPKVVLTSSANPSAVGNPVTFTVTVSASTTPTGKVMLFDYTTGSTFAAQSLSGGVATFTTSGLAVGSHTIVAYYGGDAKYSSGSASLIQVVSQAITARITTQDTDVQNVIVGSKFTVKTFPNPTTSYFVLKLLGNNTRDAISIKVMDISGRLIEVRNGLQSGQTLTIGDKYKQGVYLIEARQGKTRIITKVCKLVD